MPTVIKKVATLRRPPPPVIPPALAATPAPQSLMAQMAAMGQALAARMNAPPAAAHVVLKKVITLRLHPPASPAATQAAEDLASLSAPAAQALAGAANVVLQQNSAFWVAYYGNMAQTNPLPASHPWAGVIARDLLASL